jgi:uracil-DNA glycosylase family 4
MNRRKPIACEGCALYNHGSDFSQPEGTGSRKLLVMAEASGEHEQRDELPLRPFAPAGGLFERILRRMNIDRQQLVISNFIRCRPRNNFLENAPWEHSALNHCRQNFRDVVAKYRPHAILAMGGVATRESTGEAGEARGVSHLAGYCLPSMPDVTLEDGTPIPVIPTFHPAFLRRGKASYQGVFARILQRAMNISAGKDREWMWGVVPEDRSTHGTLRYNTRPSLDEARAYLSMLRQNGDATVSYDIETTESASLDEDAREGFADTSIRLIQFATVGGWTIALPWESGYREIATEILGLPNTKCGHNVWLFDNKVLRANGVEVAGTIHDTLQMFHHWQPDLPAHLQFCAQFVQFPFPWKHLAGTDLAFYGCCDVDATLRLYNMLQATLQRDGLWGDQTTGYLGQIYEVRPILQAMEDRGLPIDDAARLRLDAEFAIAQRDLGTEIAALAPDACLRVHPKVGYKGVPPEVKKYVGMLNIRLQESDDGEWYHYENRPFDVATLDEVTGEPVITATPRWCRVYDFNPNSSQQLLSYMKVKGHPVPKGKEEDADGKQKDTTAKKELQRLAKKTGDTFYLKVIEYRELSKMRGTYIDGFRPDTSGLVHTTFTFDTGTGQLTSRNPNIQNFPKHGRLAKPVRAMVAAPEGKIIVEADFKSYHVLTTGFCAEDASYMRMARLDMHSFITGLFLKLWTPTVMEESDAALLDRFRWLKSDPDRKRIRDKQAKPTILGVGFGMGARRLYQENLEHFPDERTARRLLDTLKAVFPKVFEWQNRVRKQAHEQQYLRSPFGHLRRFYEVFRWDSRKGDWAPGDQAEEAVAFLPANLAFGNIRECMKELRARGYDEKYGLCNNIHDSFVMVCNQNLLESFIDEVVPVLEAPSKVLKHPTLAPNGLTVDVEVCAGASWATMKELELTGRKHEPQTVCN